jgi:RimJ/RimL family protein N-acetyltransferase
MPIIQNSYHDGNIRISPPNLTEIRHALINGDVSASVDNWFSLALEGEQGVIYFAIYQQDCLVGQIFLHNGNPQTGESLVGYHLFQPEYRGQGTGTKALGLLLRYVEESTNFQHLVIITDKDNKASQRIAEKCGFRFSGPAREGLPLICYTWQRPTMSR